MNGISSFSQLCNKAREFIQSIPGGTQALKIVENPRAQALALLVLSAVGIYKLSKNPAASKALKGRVKQLREGIAAVFASPQPPTPRIPQQQFQLPHPRNIRFAPRNSRPISIRTTPQARRARRGTPAPSPSKKVDLQWPDTFANDYCLTANEETTLRRVIQAELPKVKPGESRVLQKGYLSIVSTENGSLSMLTVPRTIRLSHNGVQVLFNRHGGLAGVGKGAQTKVSHAYDPLSGRKLVKKNIVSEPQFSFIKELMKEQSQGRHVKAFPRFVSAYRGSTHLEGKPVKDGIGKCIQGLSDGTVRQLGHSHDAWNGSIQSLIDLQNALRWMHTSFKCPGGLYGFHGDISPNNVFFKRDSQGDLELKLADFGATNDLNSLYHTVGFRPPEQHRGMTQSDILEFNLKYGHKKDTWAMAMIIGSLLRKGRFDVHLQRAVPAFDFIKNKIKLDGNRPRDYDITTLTQKEVDDELNAIIADLPNTPEGRNKRKLWDVIRLWLRVNPNERQDISQAYLSPEVLEA